MKAIPKYALSTLNNLFIKRNPTVCQLMWDSVFIDKDGKVYSCCHHRPLSFGSIYEKNLEEIWNGSKRLSLLRQSSLNKSLFCHFDCNVMTKAEKEIPKPDQTHIKYPRRIWILFGELCNIKCIMCHQNHKDTTMLNSELLKKQIDWDKIDEVELQGGEILAMKEAKKFYLWLTQVKKKRVNVITNGMLINDEWAKHLVTGADWIQISVNAATKEVHEKVNQNSKYEQVIENIAKLTSAKKELNSSTRIIYKYCAVPENIHEIAKIIPLADKLGCDEVAFGYDGKMLQHLSSMEEYKETLKEELRAEINTKRPIVIERKKLEHLGLL